MRVGEMVRLNRDDIRFDERECVVFGKGTTPEYVLRYLLNANGISVSVRPWNFSGRGRRLLASRVSSVAVSYTHLRI